MYATIFLPEQGFEPSTFRSTSRCTTHWATPLVEGIYGYWNCKANPVCCEKPLGFKLIKSPKNSNATWISHGQLQKRHTLFNRGQDQKLVRMQVLLKGSINKSWLKLVHFVSGTKESYLLKLSMNRHAMDTQGFNCLW